MPCHDDRALFEMLILEEAQAGLSWSTILAKRQNYRRAFASFDPSAITRFTAKDVHGLLADPGIVRNRAKIEAVIANARSSCGPAGVWDIRPIHLGVRGRPTNRQRAALASGHARRDRSIARVEQGPNPAGLSIRWP